MGYVLIMYYSETGHTKAMVQLVSQGEISVKDTEFRLKSVDQAIADDLIKKKQYKRHY